MRIIAFGCGDRECAEIFQHFLETISRYFNSTLRAITSLASEFLQLPTSSTPFCPKKKNILGAIDGTHIPAIVPLKEQPAYCNQKGTVSHNVMTVVGFDRIFQFVAVGWEGSASDMCVLRWSMDHEILLCLQVKKYLI
ncbi:hypothetical protein AXF42_Ash006444 [Apostasia shenzhenica]|uniref:DDE Tnp4 domain-containing protein n=1 Tax=Apostasia shenzhenica TaxID=1088818 RepID=A0A2I0AZ36_9ASPA|nr:hypothetical protein AXF42_Ash006444 [Apostasia shenzhenica]